MPKQTGTNEMLTILYQSKGGQIKCGPFGIKANGDNWNSDHLVPNQMGANYKIHLSNEH